MKHLSVNVWSVILLTLAGAVSLALIAAAWLMATFCLNGLHRFGLPTGLFSVAMLLSAVPSNAQTSANDGYFVIYERIYYLQPNTISVIPRVVDTLRRHPTVLPVKQTRSIRPVPEWPKEEPVDQPVSEPTNNPFILTMPLMKPGSSEIKGLIGVRIRP